MLKEVKVSKLAEMIDMLHTGQAIEFSSGKGKDSGNWESWYFAKKMYVEEYNARFLLVDYFGGGKAQAFSIYDNYNEQQDIEECLRAYMNHIGDTDCDYFEKANEDFVVYMNEEDN